MNNLFLDALFPPRCCGCDDIIKRGERVCPECSKIIFHPSERSSRCDTCFMPVKECICSSHLFYERLASPFFYKGKVRSTLHKLKFRGRTDLIKPYAEMIKLALSERDMLEGTDIITFIPMSRLSKFKRGYNQAELLARELGKITEIPVEELLIKKYSTSTQHSLGKIGRSGNLLGVYEPIRQKTDIIEHKNILIADDIITTGNTVNEAAKTLLIFGAGNVDVCSCAVTGNKKNLTKNMLNL